MSYSVANDMIHSINPATLEIVAEVPMDNDQSVDRIIARAHAALNAWRLDKAERQKCLAEVATILEHNASDLAVLLTKEQGKPLQEAQQEIWVSRQAFSEAAALDWQEETQVEISTGKSATVRTSPFGVVAAIVPWNFPLYLAAAKIAPALAAGNTLVVKPAESVSAVVSEFVQLIARALPPGVIDVAIGGPSVGEQLVGDGRVRKVTFTGSTAVGKRIMQQAAATVTPVTLELGGNDPAILLPDADIAAAAQKLAAGAFMNAGQMCIAPKRIYVPVASLEEFSSAVSEAARARVLGNGMHAQTTMGPLHNESQLEFVRSLVRDAVEKGATITAGGQTGTDEPGYFMEPTVLVNVDDSFDVVRLEQFGPVMPIVAYSNIDDVLKTIDSQSFGLGASVWSQDSSQARRLAEGIDAGTVWINQHNALNTSLPFGGVKESGFGREGGIAGVQEFLTNRVIN